MEKEIEKTYTLIGITDRTSDKIDDVLLADFLKNKDGYAKVSDDRLALLSPCKYIESSIYFYYKDYHIEVIENHWDSVPQLNEILNCEKVKSKLDSFLADDGLCITVDICSKEEGKLYFYDKENDEWFLLGKTKNLFERLDKTADFVLFADKIRHYDRLANILTVLGCLFLIAAIFLHHFLPEYPSYGFILLLLSMFYSLTSAHISIVKRKKLIERK